MERGTSSSQALN